jgi:hypothetical protein
MAQAARPNKPGSVPAAPALLKVRREPVYATESSVMWNGQRYIVTVENCPRLRQTALDTLVTESITPFLEALSSVEEANINPDTVESMTVPVKGNGTLGTIAVAREEGERERPLSQETEQCFNKNWNELNACILEMANIFRKAKLHIHRPADASKASAKAAAAAVAAPKAAAAAAAGANPLQDALRNVKGNGNCGPLALAYGLDLLEGVQTGARVSVPKASNDKRGRKLRDLVTAHLLKPATIAALTSANLEGKDLTHEARLMISIVEAAQVAGKHSKQMPTTPKEKEAVIRTYATEVIAENGEYVDEAFFRAYAMSDPKQQIVLIVQERGAAPSLVVLPTEGPIKKNAIFVYKSGGIGGHYQGVNPKTPGFTDLITRYHNSSNAPLGNFLTNPTKKGFQALINQNPHAAASIAVLIASEEESIESRFGEILNNPSIVEALTQDDVLRHMRITEFTEPGKSFELKLNTLGLVEAKLAEILDKRAFITPNGSTKTSELRAAYEFIKARDPATAIRLSLLGLNACNLEKIKAGLRKIATREKLSEENDRPLEKGGLPQPKPGFDKIFFQDSEDDPENDTNGFFGMTRAMHELVLKTPELLLAFPNSKDKFEAINKKIELIPPGGTLILNGTSSRVDGWTLAIAKDDDLFLSDELAAILPARRAAAPAKPAAAAAAKPAQQQQQPASEEADVADSDDENEAAAAAAAAAKPARAKLTPKALADLFGNKKEEKLFGVDDPLRQQKAAAAKPDQTARDLERLLSTFKRLGEDTPETTRNALLNHPATPRDVRERLLKLQARDELLRQLAIDGDSSDDDADVKPVKVGAFLGEEELSESDEADAPAAAAKPVQPGQAAYPSPAPAPAGQWHLRGGLNGLAHQRLYERDPYSELGRNL